MFKKLIVSHTMRRRVSWLIAAVLLLPFILFFHATGQSPARGPGGVAGTIYGKAIPWQTFQEQRAWLARQLEHTFGGELPDTLLPQLTQYTWDKLLLIEEARRRHLRVDDRTLAAFIQRIPAFQEQGRFIATRYRQYLRTANMSPQTFEDLLRNDLLVEQLVSDRKQSVSVSEEAVKTAYRERREQLQATLLFFDPSSFTNQVEAAVTDDAVRAGYDANPEAFRIPAHMQLEYAGLSRDTVIDHLPVLTEEELRAYYDAHQDQFTASDTTPEPFESVQELVRERVASERARKQLTTSALDVQDDLDAHLRFEEIVAARHLTSHVTDRIPADTQWLPDGPEPEVLRAVATAPEGTLSPVIQTDRGVYIARVIQRIASRMPPFEEVRGPARQRLIQERARAAAQAAAQALHERLRSRMASGWRFEEAALLEETPLPAHHVQLTRTQPIALIDVNPSVNDAAFSTPLGGLTDVLETAQGVVMLRPEARIPADESAFAKEKDALLRALVRQQQTEQLDRWLQELRARAALKSFVDESASNAS